MKTSITSVEEASFDTPLVLKGQHNDMIKQANILGYDSIEFHIRDPFNFNLNEIYKTLKNNNISCSAIGTGTSYSKDKVYLTHFKKENREVAVKRLLKDIEIAKEFNATVIIGLIKGQIKDSYDEDLYKYYLKKNLSEILEYASNMGVILSLEIIDRYESDFLNNIEEGLEYIKKFKSDNLKLHLDTFHMNIEEPNCYKNILKCKNKIGHIHLADSDRWYLGHGHFNFEEVFKALKEINYKNAISLESFAFPDPITCAKESLDLIKRYI